jgi:hypothetical protein
MKLNSSTLFEGATNEIKIAFAEYFQKFNVVVNTQKDLTNEDREAIFNLLKHQGSAKKPDFKAIAE